MSVNQNAIRVEESCCCGATITASGYTADLIAERFRRDHEGCRLPNTAERSAAASPESSSAPSPELDQPGG